VKEVTNSRVLRFEQMKLPTKVRKDLVEKNKELCNFIDAKIEIEKILIELEKTNGQRELGNIMVKISPLFFDYITNVNVPKIFDEYIEAINSIVSLIIQPKMNTLQAIGTCIEFSRIYNTILNAEIGKENFDKRSLEIYKELSSYSSGYLAYKIGICSLKDKQKFLCDLVNKSLDKIGAIAVLEIASQDKLIFELTSFKGKSLIDIDKYYGCVKNYKRLISEYSSSTMLIDLSNEFQEFRKLSIDGVNKFIDYKKEIKKMNINENSNLEFIFKAFSINTKQNISTVTEKSTMPLIKLSSGQILSVSAEFECLAQFLNFDYAVLPDILDELYTFIKFTKANYTNCKFISHKMFKENYELAELPAYTFLRLSENLVDNSMDKFLNPISNSIDGLGNIVSKDEIVSAFDLMPEDFVPKSGDELLANNQVDGENFIQRDAFYNTKEQEKQLDELIAEDNFNVGLPVDNNLAEKERLALEKEFQEKNRDNQTKTGTNNTQKNNNSQNNYSQENYIRNNDEKKESVFSNNDADLENLMAEIRNDAKNYKEKDEKLIEEPNETIDEINKAKVTPNSDKFENIMLNQANDLFKHEKSNYTIQDETNNQDDITNSASGVGFGFISNFQSKNLAENSINDNNKDLNQILEENNFTKEAKNEKTMANNEIKNDERLTANNDSFEKSSENEKSDKTNKDEKIKSYEEIFDDNNYGVSNDDDNKELNNETIKESKKDEKNENFVDIDLTKEEYKNILNKINSLEKMVKSISENAKLQTNTEDNQTKELVAKNEEKNNSKQDALINKDKTIENLVKENNIFDFEEIIKNNEEKDSSVSDFEKELVETKNLILEIAKKIDKMMSKKDDN